MAISTGIKMSNKNMDAKSQNSNGVNKDISKIFHEIAELLDIN